jgi:hypothetical protein
MDLMSRLISPYDLNPMGKNPLRAILAETIDFERVARAPTKLFITATNVRTGRGEFVREGAEGGEEPRRHDRNTGAYRELSRAACCNVGTAAEILEM